MAVDSLTCYAKSAHYFPDRCSTSGLLVATESIYGLTGGKCPDRSENKATNYYIDGKQKAGESLLETPEGPSEDRESGRLSISPCADDGACSLVVSVWCCSGRLPLAPLSRSDALTSTRTAG